MLGLLLSLYASLLVVRRIREQLAGGRNPLLGVAPYELIFAVVLLFLYMRSRRRVSWPLVVLAVVLHYAFWLSQFGRYSLLLGRGGPLFLLPLIGFVSALVWSLYMKNLNPIHD